MIEKPVNKIDIESNIIKANDINTVINIKLTDVNNNPVNLENEIDYFYLVRNNKYYPVTDIYFNNDTISFKLPNLYKGLYKIEIKDKEGSIYPANDNVSILLNQSFESGKEAEFINMKDSILKDVPEIVTDYINDDPERFKGEDGKDGKDGVKGEKGDKGDKGDRGDPGEKGEKGADGTMSFEDLTEEQISSLKGEKGDKGDPGEKGDKGDPGVKGDKGDPGIPGKDGDIKNKEIGTNNLIDITNLTPRKGSYTFDLETGVINYENIEWYLSQYIELRGVKHSFRVQDYLINPNYGISKMILQIYDSKNNIVVNNLTVEKGTPVSIDLTGREEQTYWLQLRVTNTELFSGYIEKPMLVEGDIPVLWSPSKRDTLSGYLQGSLSGDIDGVIASPNVVTLSVVEQIDLPVENNEITMSEGYYQVNCNFRFTPAVNEYSLIVGIQINGINQMVYNLHQSMDSVGSISHIVKVNKGDKLRIVAGKNSTGTGTISFWDNIYNKITIKKIGVI